MRVCFNILSEFGFIELQNLLDLVMKSSRNMENNETKYPNSIPVVKISTFFGKIISKPSCGKPKTVWTSLLREEMKK